MEGQVYDGPIGTFTDGNTADTAASFAATISWGDGSHSAGVVTGSAGKFTVSGRHTYTEEGNYPLSAVVTDNQGHSITLGGPPTWTQLAAGLPAATDNYYSAPEIGTTYLAATGGADGKIYALGGEKEVNTSIGLIRFRSAEVDVYDPATQSWSLTTPLPIPLEYLAATTGTDGTIYAVGGYGQYPNGVYTSGVLDAYNPSTQTWTPLPGVPGGGYGLAAATGADGTIYAIGSEVDAYNPTTQTWSQLPSLPTPRTYLAAAAGADGTIYAMGGYFYSAASGYVISDEVDAYNPVTQTWSVLPSLPSARMSLAATTGKDGTIYVIGGVAGSINRPQISSEVDAYDPATQTWTVLGSSLPTARESLAAATGSDGTIYAIGGRNNNPPYLTNEVDVYPGKGANTAVVFDPPVVATGMTLSNPGLSLSGQTLATFTDPGGAEPIINYSAVIDWGDQSAPSSSDTIAYDPATGRFSVPGSHTYAEVGDYTISVTIQHDSAPPVIVTTTIQVGHVQPTAAITGLATGVTGQNLTFTVSASDPIPSLNVAGFAYSIDWADGSQASTVLATANNGSGRDLRHAFAAGSYTVLVTATDQSGNTATASMDVTIGPANTGISVVASPSPAAWGQNITFAATVAVVAPGSGMPTGTVTFKDGDTILGTGTLQVVNGVDQAVFSTTTLTVGDHSITAVYAGDSNYFGSTSSVMTETVNQVSTSTSLAISATTPLAGSGSVDLSASVTASAFGILTGSVDFIDTTTGQDLGSVNLVNGVATLLAAGPFAAGTHTLSAIYSGSTNFQGSAGNATLTALAPASLSGLVFEDFNKDGQVDFGEMGIGGVAITLTGTDDLGHSISLSQQTDGAGAYAFPGLRPGSYYLTESIQPAGYTSGIDSIGTAGGQLTATDQFFVNLATGADGLNYNYGEQPTATGVIQPGQTAGIGFWNNKNGQALIKALNGGAGTQLADWLAATFPHMFGIDAGSNNLSGQSNAAVAALFQEDFVLKGVKLDAQVLATALNVYATSARLDSSRIAAQYGFTISDQGVGTATIDIGGNGDAFGVADNTTLTIMDLLLATDVQAVNGVLYAGSAVRRKDANNVYSSVNGG